jgi:hypothetical protein
MQIITVALLAINVVVAAVILVVLVIVYGRGFTKTQYFFNVVTPALLFFIFVLEFIYIVSRSNAKILD